jgi:hypothetical protein
MVKQTKGKKFDMGKTDWSLLPWDEVEQVVKVLGFGAKRYGIDDWKFFVSKSHHELRYFSAAIRHLHAWRTGKKNDDETGFSHLAHAVCCTLFILWKEGHQRPSDSPRSKESKKHHREYRCSSQVNLGHKKMIRKDKRT